MAVWGKRVRAKYIRKGNNDEFRLILSHGSPFLRLLTRLIPTLSISPSSSTPLGAIWPATPSYLTVLTHSPATCPSGQVPCVNPSVPSSPACPSLPPYLTSSSRAADATPFPSHRPLQISPLDHTILPSTKPRCFHSGSKSQSFINSPHTTRLFPLLLISPRLLSNKFWPC